MIEVLHARWTGLARRERLMVVWAATLVAAALVYLLLIEPAWLTRSKLRTELPLLREQVAELHLLIQEVKLLKSRGAAAYTVDSAKAAIEQSLAQRNLGSARIAVLDERRIAVSAKAVSVAQWLEWIEEAARESRLRIAAVNFGTTAMRGIVDADTTFEVAKRP